jgi:hypothetical protein
MAAGLGGAAVSGGEMAGRRIGVRVHSECPAGGGGDGAGVAGVGGGMRWPAATRDEGRRWEVEVGPDRWAPPISRRERGRREAGLGRVGRKGRRAVRGKRKKGGERREVGCGPKGERKGVRFGFFLFFKSF